MSIFDVYGRMAKTYNCKTAAFRFAVVSKVCGVDTDDVNTLDSPEFRIVSTYKMTETLERLLFLYGAGIIDFTLLNEFLTMGTEIGDILECAENLLIEQQQYYETIRIPNETIIEMIRVCAVARKYMPENQLTFEEARAITDLDCVKIVNGFVKVSDKKLIEMLVKNNEMFAYYNKKDDTLELEDKDVTNILNNEDIDNKKYDSTFYPVLFAPKRIIFYDKVRHLLYGEDFFEHCTKYGEKIDENVLDTYKRYIERIKCLFTVNCYHRKRRICGDKYNSFDYYTNIRNENVKADKTGKILLTPQTEKSTDELIKEAIQEFCSKNPVQNDTILEIHNQGQIRLFAIRGDGYVPVEKDEFRNALFDFNRVWGIIQEYTIDHNIAVRDEKLEIPVELMEKFNDEEKPYAQALIREQYSRQNESKRGKIFSRLSDLVSGAAEDMKKKLAVQQQKQDLKDERAEQMAQRETQVEDVT
ncbi:MAG: hypothetical protein IKH75_08100 [Ruminococcus sp.]|nr:hypothetical protein [Ruminococcus sp.]